jgi:hypothetical protein
MDDPERPRRVETVEFEPVRVSEGRRGPSGLIIATAAVVLAAVVGVAVLGRSSGSGGSRAVADPTATPAATGGIAIGPLATHEPGLSGRLRSSEAPVVALSVTLATSSVSVRGTVLAQAVDTIEIRLVGDGGGDVAARSLSLEYPDAGAIRPANLPEFGVSISLSKSMRQAARYVEVDVYDGLGTLMGSALHWLGPVPPQRCGAGWDCPAT